MSEQELFVAAQDALGHVVNTIRDDQWTMVMPPAFSRAMKRELTLKELLNYHAYDDAWVPDMLAGKTMDEVGKEAFKGDLLGSDPKASYAKYAEAARAAVRDFTDLDKTTHLSYGDYPAREYLWHITYFRTMRSYDLAKIIGIEPMTPTELLEGLWTIIEPHAEEWRTMGVLDAPLMVPEDADKRTKILAMLGRD
jgi:uncharacterized protein (TIGR03086 family)